MHLSTKCLRSHFFYYWYLNTRAASEELTPSRKNEYCSTYVSKEHESGGRLADYQKPELWFFFFSFSLDTQVLVPY